MKTLLTILIMLSTTSSFAEFNLRVSKNKHKVSGRISTPSAEIHLNENPKRCRNQTPILSDLVILSASTCTVDSMYDSLGSGIVSFDYMIQEIYNQGTYQEYTEVKQKNYWKKLIFNGDFSSREDELYSKLEKKCEELRKSFLGLD